MAQRPPRLPDLLQRKIYKTGQTRGADPGEIYQNRVSRNSTAVIRFENYISSQEVRDQPYENGCIVVIQPEDYFDSFASQEACRQHGLKLGSNLLLFYQRREQWNEWNPDEHGLTIATSRIAPLGGEYVARVAGTTATGGDAGEPIRRGFDTTQSRGLGIREYEYAPSQVISQCRRQLSALYWLSDNSLAEAVNNGMSATNANNLRDATLRQAEAEGLLDNNRLLQSRFVNRAGNLVCPLCLEPVNARDFYSRIVQAEGRETHDQTVTEVSLFHLDELRPGYFNHRIYNLGWGHHHCNVVTKDAGITPTLEWMSRVLENNRAHTSGGD